MGEILNSLEIMNLERKIEQITKEIATLKKGIEDEDIYIGEVGKSSRKLYNAKDNLTNITEKIFESIKFLKSAEHLKSDFKSTISGSSFSAADDRILSTKRNLEDKRASHYDDIEKLKKMRENYERELSNLKQKMIEEEQANV